MLLTIVEQQTLRKCQMFTDSTSDRITSTTYNKPNNRPKSSNYVQKGIR